MTHPILYIALLVAAGGQTAVAFLNLNLMQLLGWRAELARVPLLLREVFHVHAWFITITLLIFSSFTWKFAGELAAGDSPMGRWMAASMGLFWLIRTALQVFYYSAIHWRGLPGRTAIHLVLLAAYGSLGATYLTAAFQ